MLMVVPLWVAPQSGIAMAQFPKYVCKTNIALCLRYNQTVFTKPSGIAIKNKFFAPAHCAGLFHVHCWTGFINLNPVFRFLLAWKSYFYALNWGKN
jgi:hypothetical protein